MTVEHDCAEVYRTCRSVQELLDCGPAAIEHLLDIAGPVHVCRRPRVVEYPERGGSAPACIPQFRDLYKDNMLYIMHLVPQVLYTYEGGLLWSIQIAEGLSHLHRRHNPMTLVDSSFRIFKVLLQVLCTYADGLQWSIQIAEGLLYLHPPQPHDHPPGREAGKHSTVRCGCQIENLANTCLLNLWHGVSVLIAESSSCALEIMIVHRDVRLHNMLLSGALACCATQSTFCERFADMMLQCVEKKRMRFPSCGGKPS